MELMQHNCDDEGGQIGQSILIENMEKVEATAIVSSGRDHTSAVESPAVTI